MDREHGEERADEAERQRQRSAVDELARDPRLLRGRRRVDLADQLDELALGAVGAVHEPEDADEEGEERDEREEDLVGDGAGEEPAVVGREGSDDGGGAASERERRR